MKIARSLLIAALPLIAGGGNALSQDREVRIGYVADGPYYYAEEAWEQFKKELAVLGGGRFQLVYPEQWQLVDRWDKEEIRSDCRKLLAAPEVELIVGMGLNAAAFFASQTELPKPVVLFGDMDIELAGLETEAGHSPIKNLTFQVQRGKISKELEKVKRMARGREVTVLIDASLLKDIPSLEENARRLGESAGLPYRIVFTAETVKDTLDRLPPETEFIYLAPSHFFNTRAQITGLLEGLKRKKIPAFAMEGVPVVEMGALAGLYRSSVEKIAKNNALKVYEIIQGAPPEQQSVFFRDPEEFTINLATAVQIGYFPSFDLMMEARLIGEKEETGPFITVRDAVRISLDHNLNYQVALRNAEEVGQEYKKVLAQLLPQLEASSSYQQIDPDRARSSLGMLPRWQSQGSLKLDQLIFSYPVWKSVSLARRAVSLAETGLRRAEFDTAESALQAYLDALRARELARVQKENLDSTRNHLETARVRLEQEAGSREDVLRWESEYKSALSSLIEAEMNLKKASLVFNEVLNRPQEEPFRLETLAPSREGEITAFSGRKLDRFLSNWRQADVFREFLVEAGRELSPDVALARQEVEIAEEELARSRSDLWSPTVGARLDYTRRFGEETLESDLPPEYQPLFSGDADDDEWTVSAYLSFPLWTGGSRWADLGQKRAGLRKAEQKLQLQEQSTALAIRSAFYDAAASGTNLQLNQEREALTQESLRLVEDKYKNGLLPILDLLDAQTSSVSAQAATVSAFYDSLSDLVKLERQVGFIEYLSGEREVEDFIKAATAYVEERAPGR